MPTMRHPKVDGPIEAPDTALTTYRMSGWVTEDENPDLFVVDTEPEDDDGEDKPASEPDASGENKPPAPRRPRASSKESE